MKKKKCSKCKEIKPLNEFHKDRTRKDGYQYECKICRRQYYEEHREELKQQSKQYRDNHREEKKEYARQYWRAHIDKIKKYQDDHKEEIKEYNKQYYDNHREEINEYAKQYHKSSAGRLAIARSSSKFRGLGANLITDIPYHDGEEYVLHHLNDSDIIAIPKDLHISHGGKNHRDDLLPFIENLYPNLDFSKYQT